MNEHKLPPSLGHPQEIRDANDPPRGDDRCVGNRDGTGFDQDRGLDRCRLRVGLHNVHQTAIGIMHEGTNIGFGGITSTRGGIRCFGHLMWLMAHEPGIASTRAKVEEIRQCQQGSGSWAARSGTGTTMVRNVVRGGRSSP